MAGPWRDERLGRGERGYRRIIEESFGIGLVCIPLNLYLHALGRADKLIVFPCRQKWAR